MKIKTKTLVNFLKKTRMEGDQQINECLLRFDKEGLKINANSPSQQARVMAWLKTSAFKEYEDIGNIGVNDLVTIVKVLERFGEMISISVEGNLMSVKGDNKSVDVELISETFLSTDTGEPNLQFDDTFVLSSNQLGNIIKDIQLNKDAELILETDKKKVIFSNTGKYKFRNEIEAVSCKGGVKAKFGEPFINAVSNLDGNLELSVKNDYPCKIMEKLEDSIITIIVAPRVENE